MAGLIEYKDWKHSVGEGWTDLVHEVIDVINEFNKEHPDNEFPIHIIDIKEKWGILQIDLDFYYKEVEERITQICLKSRHICEECGNSENTYTKDYHGWLKTLCPECGKKELDRIKKLFKD